MQLLIWPRVRVLKPLLYCSNLRAHSDHISMASWGEKNKKKMCKERLSDLGDFFAGNVLCIKPSCFIQFGVVTSSAIRPWDSSPFKAGNKGSSFLRETENQTFQHLYSCNGNNSMWVGHGASPEGRSVPGLCPWWLAADEWPQQSASRHGWRLRSKSFPCGLPTSLIGMRLFSLC